MEFVQLGAVTSSPLWPHSVPCNYPWGSLKLVHNRPANYLEKKQGINPRPCWKFIQQPSQRVMAYSSGDINPSRQPICAYTVRSCSHSCQLPLAQAPGCPREYFCPPNQKEQESSYATRASRKTKVLPRYGQTAHKQASTTTHPSTTCGKPFTPHLAFGYFFSQHHQTELPMLQVQN